MISATEIPSKLATCLHQQEEIEILQQNITDSANLQIQHLLRPKCSIQPVVTEYSVQD